MAGGLLAAVLLVRLPASGGIGWDVSAGLGYLAGVFALLLFLYPLRRAGLPHRRLFRVTHHRLFGWLALCLAGLHVLLLLIVDPLTGYYLLPSAPLYMLCGVIAFIALAVLVYTGLGARRAMRHHARGAMPASARGLTLTHATLSAVFLALLGAHVLGSGQLLDRHSKALVVCVVLVLTVTWSAVLSRWQGRRTPWLPVVLPAIMAAAVLLALPAPSVGSRLLEPLAHAGRALPLGFPHESHRDVNCLVCHHNWVDHTGTGSCISCHRESPAALAHSAEATFHVFCRDCHSERAAEHHKHGPTRACFPCHREAGAKDV